MSAWLEERLAEGRRLLAERQDRESREARDEVNRQASVPGYAAAVDESGFSAGAGSALPGLPAEEYDRLRDRILAERKLAPMTDVEKVRALCTREIDRLSERLAAVSAENEQLRKERDALAGAVKALSPPPAPKLADNPFARRHDGRAPDQGEPR